jgi:polar amino acid transport system substrate-binding protein
MARQTVNGYKSLFSLLEIGRVDVVIALRRETERFLAANPKFSNVKALHPPLFSVPMYHFLNKRHSGLIPRIAPVMQRLIDDRVLERLYEPYRTN